MSAGQEPAGQPAKPESFQLETKAPLLPESVPLPSPADQVSLPAEFVARLRRMDRFLVLLLLVLSFFLASFAVSNSDFWQHLATGRLIAQGNNQFGVDPYLFTTQATEQRPAVPWVNPSWLYSFFLYLLHDATGAVGVVLAKALLVVALAWLLCLMGCRAAAGPSTGTMWVALVCTTLAVVAISPRLLLQPTCVSFLFLGITWFLLTRGEGRAEGEGWAISNRPLWLLPVLFALWANLDGFFVLGLFTVALYLLGLLVGRWTGSTTAGASPATVALVLLASLAACLLNPHHMQVFTLPGELSYLAAQAADGLGLEMPESLGGPGRVLLQMQRHDPQFFPLPSPVNRSYLTNYALGWNAAGLGYFLLLGLNLLSFVLTALSAGKETLWTRLLPCLFLAVLSLLGARLIPYFAIVAGPVTAVNLQEWFRQQSWGQGTTPRSRSWSVVGRLLTGLGLILLLYLAWPGWLHSRWGEPASSRRVAWHIDVDPSLAQLALQLQSWQEQGRLGNGFAFSPDVANYCAWFAPAVKNSFDHRLALYRRDVDSIFRIRQALWAQARFFVEEGKLSLPLFDWPAFFHAHGIDHLIITNWQDRRNQKLTQMLWRDTNRWTELYADGRAMVFGWKAPRQPDRFAPLRYDRDRLAFGPVPLSQRPPEQGTDYVQKAPLFWDVYAQGFPGQPLASQEALQHMDHYLWLAQHWQIPWRTAWAHSSWCPVAGLGPSAPGSVLGPATLAAIFQLPGRLFTLSRPNGQPFLSATDVGLPADLILAVRSSRRAQAENPFDPLVYVTLAQTYQLLREQEDHWVNYPSQGAQLLRPMLRRLQLLAALKQLSALSPDDSEVHQQLGRLFLSLNYRDLAVAHLSLAVKYLKPFPQENQENFSNRKRGREQFLQQLHQDLKNRQNQFNLRSTGLRSLQKYQLALFEPFKFIDADNKEHVDPGGYGLVLTALGIVQEAATASLPDQEKSMANAGLVSLLINTGHFPEAIQELAREDVPQKLGPGRLHEFLVLVAAALGNYRQADSSLAELEKMIDLDQRRQAFRLVAVHFLGWKLVGAHFPQARLSGLSVLPEFLSQRRAFFEGSAQRVADLRTLRGLLALESGDTAQAAAMFAKALELAGPERGFPDRPIAARYAELMKGKNQ